jgi:hypothetical protein
MSRAAIRQLILLGAVAVVGFIALMGALAWASSLTGGGAAARGAYDVEARTITLALAQEPPQLDSTRASGTSSPARPEAVPSPPQAA